MLLEKGADFTTANNNGWTPLNSASNSGYAEVVKMLLEKGADFTTISNDGWTPLNSASAEGHVDVVKFLFEASPFDTAEMDSFGRTALFLASRHGRLPVVQYLLSTRAFDPDIKNYYGSTALSTAVANGHYEVVELLISTGVSTQEQFHVGRSLLWWASRTGKPQLIKLLSQHMGLGETFPQHDSFSSQAIFDTASAWCDVCTLSIPSSSIYYSCQECCGFALCGMCHDDGFRCRDQAHTLIVNPDEGC
jgi:ankyrin repeat protein